MPRADPARTVPGRSHMPRTMPPDLAYLADALDDFARDLRDDVDAEDLDPVPLELALRARLTGEPDPRADVAADLAALEAWLKTFPSEDHPGWVAAGMLRGLLEYGFEVDTLGETPDPGPLPAVAVDAPPGWMAESSPGSLTLTKRGRDAVYAFFTAAPPGVPFPLREQWAAAGVSAESITFGPVGGAKRAGGGPGPAPVQCVLDAPGGTVLLTVFSESGGSFDEAEVEAVLHTLRVTPPGGM